MWFVQQENVKLFAEELCYEVDPTKRETLRQLLLREEVRYGFHSAQLDMAEQHIS
jgi:hypothetical protein